MQFVLRDFSEDEVDKNASEKPPVTSKAKSAFQK